MPSCFSCLVPSPARQSKVNENTTDDSNVLRTPIPSNMVLPPPTASVGMYILQKLKATPDLVAQVDAISGVEDTYEQMLDRSVRTALWLKSRGLKPGDVVTVCSHNHIDTVIPMYAAFYNALTFAPWDPLMNCKDLKYLTAMSKPKVVFCNEESACTVLVALRESNSDADVVVFGEHSKCIAFRDILSPHSPEDVNNFQYTPLDEKSQVALIVCSSGSTGLPKGVEHTHRTILLQCNGVRLLNLENKVCFVFSSMFWISGLLGMFLSVAGNMKRIITPVFEEDLCSKMIENYKVNWVLLGTSILIRLVYSGYLEKYDLSSLERISGGGGVVSTEAYERLQAAVPHAQITLGYGMTELGGATTIQDATSKPGSCGRPVLGTALKVIDTETGKSLPVGQVGELCWQSPCVMRGYRNNPKETAETIDKEGWLHSGDIGYYDKDGLIFVVDKQKEMIKYRGNQIAPAELEGIIVAHPGVRECVVIGKPHVVDVEHPVAFVVRNADSNVTEQEIMDLVSREVIDRKRLRGGVRFLDELPLTPSGKPKRAVLKKMLREEK